MNCDGGVVIVPIRLLLEIIISKVEGIDENDCLFVGIVVEVKINSEIEGALEGEGDGKLEVKGSEGFAVTVNSVHEEIKSVFAE